MKRKHAISEMVLSNLDAWVNSPRVAIMIVCMVVYCIVLGAVERIEFLVDGVEIKLTVAENLFLRLYNSFNIMGNLLFLVAVSEIPRRIPFQQMMLIRSTRRKWITSQCLYCALMVVVAILLLCTIFTIAVLPTSSLENTFTENKFIEAGCYEEGESLIPAYIRRSFTPWSACLVAAVPMFFFWFTMVLMIFLCSMMNRPMLGPSLYGFILFAQRTLHVEFLPRELVLPTEFISLGAIVAKCAEGELHHLAVVLIGYLIVDAGLIFVLCRITRRTDFAFFEQK